MNKTHTLLSLALALGLVLAACAPGAPPAPPDTTPSATPTPTPPPEPILGSTMKWFDGTLLVFVPGGSFIMGRPGQEDNPETEVSTGGFWIYRTKVTNAQYLQCVAAGACTPPASGKGFPNPASPENKDRPVVGVSHTQAAAYCDWMRGRLPTEVEWEKTARGPSGNLYPWGNDDPTCTLANFNNCFGETTRVFDFPDGQSYYYALDMSGNAYEWMLDWYQPTFASEASTTLRSVRGSNYKDGAEQVQPSRRSYLEPDKFRADLGFRCVIPQPGETQSFAPLCQMPPTIPGGQGNNDPQPGQPAPGPQQTTPAECELPTLTVNTTSFCAQSPSLGGATVVPSISGGTGMVSYGYPDNGLEPNCKFDININKIVCVGPADTKTTITLCTTCQNDPGPQQPQTPTCDAGYALNLQTGMCELIGQQTGPTIAGGGISCPPGYFLDPASLQCVPWTPPQDCPSGYSLDPQANCCVSQPADPGNQPGGQGDSYPLCPPGTTWTPNLQACLPEQPAGPNKKLSCKEYPVYLGICQQGGKVCFQPSQYTTAASCAAANCLWVANPKTQRDPYCSYP